MQTLSSQGREKELFHHGQFGEVVVMFSLGDQFGREAGLLRVECKGVEVYIEPVERFSEDVLVLHLIVHNAATHPFPRNYLYREQEAAFLLLFRAATHNFPRNSLCRKRETSPEKKTTAAPQKKSARIGSD